jgi:hypothetical protein
MSMRPLVAMGAFVLAAAPLGAWGGTGHHVVVRIALAQLPPAVAAAVHDLLGAEDPVEASTWADRVRGDRPWTYNWHFVNVPIDARSYVAERDCRPTDEGDCIVAAIAAR